MPITEAEELELLRLQKAKAMAATTANGGMDLATNPAAVKTKFEAGELDRDNALQQLRNVGIENPESLLERRKPAQGVAGNVLGAAANVARGYTGGFSDEIAAGLAAPVVSVGKTLMGYPTTLKEGYQAALPETRAIQDTFTEEHPIASGVANVTGGVLQGRNLLKSGLAGAPVKQALTLPGAARNAVTGAGTGAVIGAGEAKEGERLKGAAEGAVGGAVAGVAAPAALKVGGEALKVGKRVLVGRDADAVFADIVGRSDKNPNQLLGELQQGEISGVADIAGDEVQGLTRSIAKTSGGKDIISDALENRSEDAVRRVSDALSKDISNVDTYFGKLDDIAKARSKVAAPLYQKAFEANKTIASPEIEAVLNTPAGKNALKQAGIKMQNDMAGMGVPDKELMEQARIAGLESPPEGIAKGLNLRSLDYVKRALDDQIDTAIRAGENDNVRILTGIKNSLVRALDAADKTARGGKLGSYAKARTVFSGFAKMKEAQEMGRKFDTFQPEQLRNMLKDMTPGERDAFRIGVRSKMQETVNKTADGADPAKRIFGNTQKRLQLQEVFPNPAKYEAFSRRMGEEVNAARTKARILGGSRTDFNIDADATLTDVVDRIAKQGVTQGALSAAWDKTAAFLKNRYLGITQDNARAVAKALIDRETGIETLKRLIKTNSNAAPAARGALNALQGSRGAQAPNPRGRVRINVQPRRK